MLDHVELARSLVDIDSTTGLEHQAGVWLARYLRDLGYTVTQQPVSKARFNVFARLEAPPQLVFSTHYDCVPPFFPSSHREGLLFGRGSCDAKGILATQVAAAERLRAEGERRIGLLFIVGEERGSDGARVANEQPPSNPRFLVNGEPTDNRLGLATRGVLRLRLHARGRAAHSSFPELGESAIDKLIDALVAIRRVPLPDDPLLGRTHYSIGRIEGGIAPNVVSPAAFAELLFRTVGDADAVRERLRQIEDRVSLEYVLDMPPVHLHTVPGFETAVFPYTTDVPFLARWGVPLLLGPGSIHDAHTADEHVAVEALNVAVELYARLARQLLSSS